MYKRIKFIIVAIAAALMAQTGRPDLITGNMGFSGAFALDTLSTATATGVSLWDSAYAMPESASGSFATTITSRTAMTFGTNFWNFNTTIPATNFWSVGGFTCELQSSQVSFRSSGFLDVSGQAVISGNGYTPTLCNFAFQTSDPPVSYSPPTWTFSFSVSATTTNGEPVLVSAVTTDGIVLSWSDPTFSLQAAPTADGIYTNIPCAVSPYTNAFTGSAQYFRLVQ